MTTNEEMRWRLRVKIKSLAAESRIIRADELKAKGDRYLGVRASLHSHRVGAVRFASRNAQLAYAFLRGKSYAQVEGNAKSKPHWPAVAGDVVRFSRRSSLAKDETLAELKAWAKGEAIEKAA